MATSALPLEILRNGLNHCYYLSLHCRTCGDVRTAIPWTQRALPFWNQIRESVSLRQLIDNHWLLQKARASS
jgi:hypothetical protein